MKILVVIKDLQLRHQFSETFVSLWTNQQKETHVLTKSNTKVMLDENINLYSPLGIIFCAYGIREVDGDKVTHSFGTAVVDMSKIKFKEENLIVSPLTDVDIRCGTMHVSISWGADVVPPPIPFDDRFIEKMHMAAEKNLSLIYPFSSTGFEPLHPILQRIHSPYYTTCTGVQLPSGAFLLESGNDTNATSHVERLRAVLKCTGWDEQTFVKNVRAFDNGTDEASIVLNVLAKTLTMHSVQCLKYVADVQFDGNSECPTDRWECPRYANNYVGDCEDCSKEIFVETEEWRNIVSEDKTIRAFQKALSMFVPVVVQGCVLLKGCHRNHIWAALIPKDDFIQRCEGKKVKPSLPTILLEGTSMTASISTQQMFYTKKLNKIKKKENIFKHIEHEDVAPHCFYKYVVACMTPQFKEKGVLDFTFISNDKYGITFGDWWDGKYAMKPSCKHSVDTMHMMEHTVSYDKPIAPLLYNTTILESDTQNHYPCVNNIVFGYKRTDETQHKKIIEAVHRLRKIGWIVSVNTIQHGQTKWVDCTFQNVEASPQPMILL